MARWRIAIGTLLAVLGSASVASGAHAALTKRARHPDGPCRVLAAWTSEPPKEKCAEPPGVSTEEPQNLREQETGATTTPESRGSPTDGLLVNTESAIRVMLKVAGTVITTECPLRSCFIGVHLDTNPVASSSECKAATGAISWAEGGNVTPSAVFAGTSSWPVTIFSESHGCSEAERGLVTIRDVSLLFETIGAGKSPLIASGTYTGRYDQPGATCPAGGVELAREAQGITTEPATERLEVAGEGERAAFLCFVSAGSYLFPKEPAEWERFTNATGKEGVGIWTTKEP